MLYNLEQQDILQKLIEGFFKGLNEIDAFANISPDECDEYQSDFIQRIGKILLSSDISDIVLD